MGDVEGFLPRGIPGQKERLFPPIPDGQGEHAQELRQESFTLALPHPAKGATITLGDVQWPLLLLEALSELQVVVDFAVCKSDHIPNLKRLAASLAGIHDGETPVAQMHRARVKRPLLVWAPMA
jgi:hypothetical protein